MRHVSRKLQLNAMLVVAVSALVAGVVLASAAAGDRGPHRRHRARQHSLRARASARGGHQRTGAVGDEVRLAGAYLGLARAQLRARLQSGGPLAQIADATGGKSAAGLIEALVRAKAARLSVAVSTGELTQTKAQVRLTGVHTRVTLDVYGATALLDLPAAASYLDVSAAQLRHQLRSGLSLAQIADATPGRSAAGLIDALVSARQDSVDAAVASGALDRAATRKYLSGLRRRIVAEVGGARRQ